MTKKKTVAWYAPGPEFKISKGVKTFILDMFLIFVAGGLNAVIAAIEGGKLLLPQELLAYSGLILAILHTIYTVVVNYKNGIQN